LKFERFPLGPSLGQCCGGVVWLTFEYVSGDLADVLAALRERRAEDSWRYTALDGEPACGVVDAQGRLVAGAQPPAELPRGEAGLAQDATGRRWLIDPCLAPRAHLILFGAGHVGAAIVRALAELPCNVTWVDERDDMFPPTIPPNVRIEATDTPEACVAEAPPGASYLVMTHSHALDQRLSEAILQRQDVGWFGLIGSKTKRAQFTGRLEAKGLSADRMVCPIGLPGIINKAPAVIATSVAAQLLMVWEDQTKD
jgi:xanthine dehydrogenase accessory factor